MFHPLRAIDGEDETIAKAEVIVGFDDDLAGESAGSGRVQLQWAATGKHRGG